MVPRVSPVEEFGPLDGRAWPDDPSPTLPSARDEFEELLSKLLNMEEA